MKIDHSSFAWKVTKNRMVLSDPNKNYAKTVDKDNLTREKRKRIEEIKDRLTYGDLDE